MNLRYRFEQFRELLRAHPLSDAAWEEINALLTPAEVDLFKRFSLADRQHSYRVMLTLREAGYNHPDLLSAALLHDVGKARLPLTLVERIVGALGDIFAPQFVERWGQGEPAGWRRPFIIRAQHPMWGAEMAKAAGSRPLTLQLIRHHQDKESALGSEQATLLLRRLQWADDQN